MFAIVLFILGLFFGSFFLVLAERLPAGESVIIGRSHCRFCKHPLSWIDLIPVLSYIFLSGKCRYCHRHFGLRYPLVELSTGLLFVITFLFLQYAVGMKYQVLSIKYIVELVFYLFLTSSFITIFLADMWYGIIPDAILFPTIVFTFIYLILNVKYLILTNMLVGLGAFGAFLLLFLATRGKGIGFGDVKLALLVGLLTGIPGILISLYLAFISGAIVSLVLIALRKKKLRGDTIAFAPFLLMGTYISIFFRKFYMAYYDGKDISYFMKIKNGFTTFSLHERGFTLVELLVVVAIIGILSTLVIVNLGSVRLRARDAQRKSDLRQIQSALELYRADQGAYLVVNASPFQINACPASFASGTTTYMRTLPCDPLGSGGYNSGNYYYYSDGTTYTLAACLENTNDGDPQVTKTPPAGSAGCTSGYYFVLYNP